MATSFLKCDNVGMQREVAAARGKSGAEDWITDHQAFALAYSGHLQAARVMSQRTSDLAQQAAHQERAALFETRCGIVGSLFREGASREAKGNGKQWQHGSTFAYQEPGSAVWRGPRPGYLGGFFTSLNTGERFGKELPRGHFR